MTPLHTVAREGNLEHVRSLLREGADVHALDAFGRTPLYHAAFASRAEVVTALLAAGADPDQADEGGITPLMAAIHIHLVEGLDLYYGYGIYFQVTPDEEIATVKALLVGRPDLDRADRGGRTAMHYAANKLNREVFDLLGETGADLTLRDKTGSDAKQMAHGTWDPDDEYSVKLHAHITEVTRHAQVRNASSARISR